MMKSFLPLTLIAGWLSVQATGMQAPSSSSNGGSGPSGTAADAAAASAAMKQALAADLRAIIARPGWRGDRWSVMVRSLERGDTLFSYGGTDPLAPASNMKLFTTAAALYYLGPDFRYNTFLMAAGPIRDGVLEGDLVVYGTGDPTLSNRFGDRMYVWNAFADTLEALGVREIRGSVVGDGSYFTGPGAGEGWQEGYMNASYAASAGALSFSENVATLQIRPGEQVGWRPRVELVPGGEGVAIVNQAVTVASGRTAISAARMAYDGPIVVRGRIARGAGAVQRTVPVSDPERFASAVFRHVLGERGIVVRGGTASAHTTEESPVTGRSVFAPALDSEEPVRVLAVHTSAPLIQVLTIINKRSHNLMAEQVLRTVGRVATGEGSVEGGRRAIEHMLEAYGRTPEIEIYDGSGLSVLNRSSASGILDVLELMAASPMWPYYWETLPEAGARDGLRRMYRTNAERNLRAKTGTIDRVSALSGYVTAANGERLAFSIISNNVPSTWMAKRVEDAIGSRLSDFDRPRPARQPAGTPLERTGARPTPTTFAPVPRADALPPTRTHTIRRGETLSHLASRYGVTIGAIERENPGLNPRRIFVGQSVRIPTPGVAPAPTDPAPPETEPAASAGPRTHEIRPGDTFDAIARRYGTSVRALQDANPGIDPRRLIPGRTIRIP